MDCQENIAENKANQVLETAADWFIIYKEPKLKGKIEEGMDKIKSGIPLEGNWKKLFAFILFSFSMAQGPPVFIIIQEAVGQIGVLQEFEDYAKDWIAYSDRVNPNHP